MPRPHGGGNIVRWQSRLWDKGGGDLQVVEAGAPTMQLSALVSARNSPQPWDLRCEVREEPVAFLRGDMPEALQRKPAHLSPPLAVNEPEALIPPAAALTGDARGERFEHGPGGNRDGCGNDDVAQRSLHAGLNTAERPVFDLGRRIPMDELQGRKV